MINKIVMILCIIVLMLTVNSCGTKEEVSSIEDTPVETREISLDDNAKLALSLIGKTTGEVISILGDNYEEGLTSDGRLWFKYKDAELELILESYNNYSTEIKVYKIWFGENYAFNGCKSGMEFDQIRENLGDDAEMGKITMIDGHDVTRYILKYTFGNAELKFVSDEQDGSDSYMILTMLGEAPTANEYYKLGNKLR